MSKLASAIIDLVRSASGGRKLNVGLLFRGNMSVVEQIAAEGHRVVVIGDRFHLLYKLYRRLGRASQEKPLMIEARLDALPIRSRSLDALILSRGLPNVCGATPHSTLDGFCHLLKDSGLFVWPHPIIDGARGKAGRVVTPCRPGIVTAMRRNEISALAMKSGFSEVGQILVRGALVPWVVTVGRAGARPWKRAS